MTGYDRWVLDVTLGTDDVMAFCPLEPDRVVVGLTMVTDQPPGRVVGVFHQDGQAAAEAWCLAHRDVLDRLGIPQAEVPSLGQGPHPWREGGD